MNASTDMRGVIIPKSDQINADDLLAGPQTITIREVTIRSTPEQPVSIHFEGDNGKPWKPCKSMSRVLVAAWGPDAKAYVGRSATLYCDPKVKWGGMQVGGIRISHLSHIDREMNLALTETKGKRAPFTVRPMAGAPGAAAKPQAEAPKKDTIGFALPDGEVREFPRNLGGLEMYIEGFDQAFDAAPDKAVWFDANKAQFHDLALGAVGSRSKNARFEKLAARFDAVAAKIEAALASPEDDDGGDEDGADDDAIDAPDAPAIQILPIPQRDGGGLDYAAWNTAAHEAIRAATDAAWLTAWVTAHGEQIKAIGAAKKTWPGEIAHAVTVRIAELEGAQ
jgi:hypothetical protein